MGYEVVVPSTRSKEQFLAAAKTITDKLSTVRSTFTGVLESFGVKVFSVNVVQEAVLAEAVVIKNSQKKIVKFNELPAATSMTSSGFKSNVNIEAWGGVIAALVLGLIMAIVCCSCKRDCRSPKPEASEAWHVSQPL